MTSGEYNREENIDLSLHIIATDFIVVDATDLRNEHICEAKHRFDTYNNIIILKLESSFTQRHEEMKKKQTITKCIECPLIIFIFYNRFYNFVKVVYE